MPNPKKRPSPSSGNSDASSSKRTKEPQYFITKNGEIYITVFTVRGLPKWQRL
jgi:hypothetical protein